MKPYYLITVLFLYVLTGFTAAQTWVHPSDRPQVETPIAINPTNPDNLIGAAITQDPAVQANQISNYYWV